ncbi:DNA mismatch repair protein MutL [Clostridium homopropionicum DSM 5847]|uniref:DNA mismatch repair protein MutL n=1 Tax=Clostridium homopropionicum DSM 5847 TaxID=1121318 RepID=A0A0L6ZDN7_9CLOT|nr:DNA mismatch repair endonuclease MutL [Clostridium homopropionicum]KOA20903.1 DNA mismatch repair protein MutL [Clostridium homopropionicum DSM 5847]SFG02532.1 DNA mismatch repair protein MutL [Clostridium homopropionicum]
MNRINLLDEEISNKIAAGEVVERPASVVKELVENSIDANAKNITIEIEESGQKSIKITDNGTGIHPDDIEKAFMPHGTSKIKKVEDLFSVNTFGFRGEALPSIASVSKVNLISRMEGNPFGKEIHLSGGKIELIEDIGSNVGTTILVQNLFFNVPARQKFLKSDQREGSLISNIVTRLALANHNISFKYYINDKKSLITFATEDSKDTIRNIYGNNVYNNLIQFEGCTDIASVHGYIGNSEISRGSRNNQSIFVNKRYIKSGLITAAVENAFKSFLTINRYPFFVLFIEIFPELIDVNVHPTKSEVKFQDERIIYKLVFESVHSALRDYVKGTFNKEEELDLPFINKEVPKVEDIEPKLVQLPIDLKEEKENQVSKFKNSEYAFDNHNSKQDDTSIKEEIPNYLNKTEASIKEAIEPKFPALDIIGQFNNTYILAECNGTLYMIDQHAAHEKILFEKYKNDIIKSKVVSQILITPILMELSHEDYSYYNENINIFIQAGFSIDLFGDNTISIREIPIFLGKVGIKNLFIDILDNIKNMGSGKTIEVKYDTIASIACKAAIKASHQLSKLEMAALIDELRYINEPFNCPHGRPTIITMDVKDIEKRFKRT